MDAFLGTLFAGFGADAAVVHSHIGMSTAFFGAGRADVGADLAHAVNVFSIHHHDFGCRAADGGAFQVQTDTFA